MNKCVWTKRQDFVFDLSFVFCFGVFLTFGFLLSVLIHSPLKIFSMCSDYRKFQVVSKTEIINQSVDFNNIYKKTVRIVMNHEDSLH